MSLGVPEQPERWNVGSGKHFKNKYHRQKHLRWWHIGKKFQLRRERRRAKADPECQPEYKKLLGWW